MKYVVCWITGVAAILLFVACVWLITTGSLMHPGQPTVLGLVLAGMTCGVIASALGAISFMTYQTPFERKHWAGINRMEKNAVTDANTIVAHSPSAGLK